MQRARDDEDNIVDHVAVRAQVQEAAQRLIRLRMIVDVMPFLLLPLLVD